jgi:hypothetical protein
MQVSRRTLTAALSSVTALGLLIGGYFALTSGTKPAPKPKQVAVVVHKAKRKQRLMSPFTGEPIKSLGPELIYKIDNVEMARPPTGLTHADIVYILPVDAGLSRIFAVFSSYFPRVVGPVRSARAEDLQLLREFWKPAFVWSGAQSKLLYVVLRAHIVDLYAWISQGFYRDYRRIAPYNLYTDTKVLLRQAKGASKAHNIGFRFGRPPPGGRRVTSWSVTYPSASFTFRWSARKHRWLVWMDGRPAWATEGGQLGGRTVVIQNVVVGLSHFKEYGVEPPYVNSIGHGTAIVLRNGRAYSVHWSRRRATGGTYYTLPDGKPMRFARGQVWVIFKYGPGSTAPRVP